MVTFNLLDPGDFLPERRNSNDYIKDMKRLAKNYTPEWNFDTEDPDIAGTIGILYSSMLEENSRRMNQTMDRYYTELINLLDITAKPAIPAESIICLELAQDTLSGVEVPKGTKFTSEASGDESRDPLADTDNYAVFESMEDLYVTNSSISNAFMTDMKRGIMSPIAGDYPLPQVLHRDLSDTVDKEEELSDALISLETETGDENTVYNEGLISTFKPFTLFGVKDGINNNLTAIYHPVMFDAIGNPMYLTIKGNKDIIDKFLDGTFSFSYPVNNKLIPIEHVKLLDDNETFCLIKEKKSDRQLILDRSYGMIAIESKEPVLNDCLVDALYISSKSEKEAAEYVGSADREYESLNFKPFTDSMQLYNECYIGHDSFFAMKDATISVSFDLYYEDRIVNLNETEADRKLAIIRKRAGSDFELNPAKVFAEDVSFEYFNGAIWKGLPLGYDYSRLFDTNTSGHIELSFKCPADWDKDGAKAYDGRQIRLVLNKADNCYLRPSIHYYPVIRNLKLSYSYDDNNITPEIISLVSGTRQKYLANVLRTGKSFPMFSGMGYTEDALYLGFDEKPENGPIGLFFKISEKLRYNPVSIAFEYSTRNGFERLKVQDETFELSRSGLLYFMPPADFYPLSLEGIENYWLRIVNIAPGELCFDSLPVIEDIRLNCVRVANIETMPEQYFLLDEIKPGVTFELDYENILYADVWVNEFLQTTPVQKKELLTKPEICRAEYDLRGEMTAFYVKWEEVTAFDENVPRRSYILDRHISTIIFGDGITTDIPKNQSGVALKVIAKRSIGRAGNVDEGEINNSLDNLYFIGRMYNPIKAYGGSSMENLDSALQRGANLIANRNRLVSKKDFLVEINSFSDVIDKSSIVSGLRPDGESDDAALSICLLMKDYKGGSYSFHRIVNKIRAHILDRSELIIDPESIYITEPVFVELSVNVWANSVNSNDNFRLLNMLKENLDAYLNPLKSEGSIWEIGKLPSTEQIRLRLNSLRSVLSIRNIQVVAKYSDSEGVHEKSLDELKVTPFMIAVSGTHHIK